MDRPKRDEYVLIVSDSGEIRRKILWVSENRIEWRGGSARIADLQPNPKKKRSSKYILNLKEYDNV